MEFFTSLTREYATFQIHNRKEHFPNLSNSHRQVIHESITPPLFAPHGEITPSSSLTPFNGETP